MVLPHIPLLRDYFHYPPLARLRGKSFFSSIPIEDDPLLQCIRTDYLDHDDVLHLPEIHPS